MMMVEYKFTRFCHGKLFQKKDLEAIIKGDFERLDNFFIWRGSPQGQEYWSARCHLGTPLSDEDKEYLVDLHLAFGNLTQEQIDKRIEEDGNQW